MLRSTFPPTKTELLSTKSSVFVYPSRRFGISSRVSVYIITEGASSRGLMIYKAFVLIDLQKCGIIYSQRGVSMKKNKTDLILTIWIATGIVIIAGFFLFGFIIGGNATLGYCEVDTYFVGNHGEYTQVSETIYRISYVWEILFWIFIPLTPIGGFLFSHIQEKREQKKNRKE